ncbi:MAG: hypothetical protein N2313_09850 [Meiothermus ruber]|jgi:hypothetical protein|uniref:Uncharacterized protein n=1 Tax=Meiothermus ruber TaxID=277 RepID=A0A7C3DQP6_MEIRU|nr:hypothetical protein [Meiothermus ruber]
MLGLIWFLFTVFAAYMAAQFVRQPRFWRTDSPALGEVISVWLILTLVLAGSLMGLRELLALLWPQSPAWLSAR